MQNSLGTLHDAEARGDFFRDIAEARPAAVPPDGAGSAALSLAESPTDDGRLLKQAGAARGKIAKIEAKDIFARA